MFELREDTNIQPVIQSHGLNGEEATSKLTYTVIGRIQFLAGWFGWSIAIVHWPLAGDCPVFLAMRASS